MTVAVELREVSKSYGNAAIPAVDSVSLEVLPGEFFALLGPSGCGKTSTLRMVAGLVEPTSGEVYIYGKPMSGTPVHRRSTGMVFQSYALFPHMTVWDNVAFGPISRGLRKDDVAQRVRGALDMVHMLRLKDRYPRQLSGGEQQRVALARASATDPEVLLLDEPLGALDRQLRDEMQIELRRFQRQLGIAAMFVTHDQEEAITLADRIGIMNQGSLVQVGSPADLYERPQDVFVADFLGIGNLLQSTVVEGGPDLVTLRTDGGLVVRAKAGQSWATGTRVTAILRPERIKFVGPIHSATHDLSENMYEGAIEHVIYMGPTVRYHIRLNSIDILVGAEPNRVRVSDSVREGDRAVVTWIPDDVHVIERPAPNISEEEQGQRHD